MHATVVTTAKHPAARLARRALAGLLAGATALTLVMAGAASPASAATPQYVPVTCGWYLQPHPAGGIADLKVSTVGLPWVSGTSTTSQLVWVYVQFLHHRSTGWVTYRAAWFKTSAKAGVWTKSWTSYATGATNQTTTRDAGGYGESGYTGAELANEDVYVSLTISWMSGSSSTTLNQTQIFANAVNNANNGAVCNGGSNIY